VESDFRQSLEELAFDIISFEGNWRGRRYNTKQIEVYAVEEKEDWVVITVMTKYF
jgi:hypothetical protein